MDSFIRWIGGKKLLRKKILSLFPQKGTFSRYVEVFGGAGWVLFASGRHAQVEVYNDINGNLVNLFRCVKYHPDALQEELAFMLNSREQFFDAREQNNIRGLTDIQRAARFFVLIKESFGADLQSFGMRAADIENAKGYLKAASLRLNNVIVENQDFKKVIKNHDKESTLFYLDPPYYGAEGYYDDKFKAEDHMELRAILGGIKGKFILSYNDCGYVRKLYKDYSVTEAERMNNLAKGGDKKPRYKELLIKNY